ncbi:MAG: N-acetylmuramoyl-L-alanine amidase [Acidobacteria bacterium]|nr:N-acetylmuramoyl-L-alanine amidase [Acidobacteriota bacterium]
MGRFSLSLRTQAPAPLAGGTLHAESGAAAARLLAAVALVGICSMLLPVPPVHSEVSISAPGGFPERALPRDHGRVWKVEDGDGYELYSNGLRIDNTHQVLGVPRFYQVLDRRVMWPLEDWRSEPAGIVYHATETASGEFAPERNEALRSASRALVRLVRRNQSYNFLIDRFGRVFRIVHESEAANHAGNSLWADDRYAYLNLNNSFVAVAFEGQTDSPGGVSPLTCAQVTAGRLLTEVLRARYEIPARNCVTHAQVSVNPDNMRIGYHTDWARHFPFREMGLPDNYSAALPSIREFGFTYDEVFQSAVGERVWPGLTAAELRLDHDASSRGERYRKLYTALKLTGALDEPLAPAAPPSP